MNLFNKWILKRAAIIEAKKEVERDVQVEYWRERQHLYTKARAVLNSFIQPKIVEMERQSCHVLEGDTAVLNVYELVHKCYNGWDGGPNSYLGLCGKDAKIYPILCKIEKVYVDTSFFRELTDKFLDNTSIPSNANDELILSSFLSFLDKRASGNCVFDRYGLYRTAKFTPLNADFKPSWGLNVGSFLNVNTPEGKETIEVWEREAALEIARLDAKKTLDTIEEKKRELFSKYRGIVYC